ncbi:hypothetical protein DASC09_058460 [Saccharomycopsis crataegensis]|uniref:Uncharacterized protein n=1 Tax=Saccharomycopsis crataegensis TaxID=43959 RepID=A0AAV5QVB1_9ASCO|nr:hypothetical protein DASC09_058460 [Saccharomycopsis crataegensis]
MRRASDVRKNRKGIGKEKKGSRAGNKGDEKPKSKLNGTEPQNNRNQSNGNKVDGDVAMEKADDANEKKDPEYDSITHTNTPKGLQTYTSRPIYEVSDDDDLRNDSYFPQPKRHKSSRIVLYKPNATADEGGSEYPIYESNSRDDEVISIPNISHTERIGAVQEDCSTLSFKVNSQNVDWVLTESFLYSNATSYFQLPDPNKELMEENVRIREKKTQTVKDKKKQTISRKEPTEDKRRPANKDKKCGQISQKEPSSSIKRPANNDKDEMIPEDVPIRSLKRPTNNPEDKNGMVSKEAPKPSSKKNTATMNLSQLIKGSGIPLFKLTPHQFSLIIMRFCFCSYNDYSNFSQFPDIFQDMKLTTQFLSKVIAHSVEKFDYIDHDDLQDYVHTISGDNKKEESQIDLRCFVLLSLSIHALQTEVIDIPSKPYRGRLLVYIYSLFRQLKQKLILLYRINKQVVPSKQCTLMFQALLVGLEFQVFYFETHCTIIETEIQKNYDPSKTQKTNHELRRKNELANRAFDLGELTAMTIAGQYYRGIEHHGYFLEKSYFRLQFLDLLVSCLSSSPLTISWPGLVLPSSELSEFAPENIRKNILQNEGDQSLTFQNDQLVYYVPLVRKIVTTTIFGDSSCKDSELKSLHGLEKEKLRILKSLGTLLLNFNKKSSAGDSELSVAHGILHYEMRVVMHEILTITIIQMSLDAKDFEKSYKRDLRFLKGLTILIKTLEFWFWLGENDVLREEEVGIVADGIICLVNIWGDLRIMELLEIYFASNTVSLCGDSQKPIYKRKKSTFNDLDRKMKAIDSEIKTKKYYSVIEILSGELDKMLKISDMAMNNGKLACFLKVEKAGIDLSKSLTIFRTLAAVLSKPIGKVKSPKEI